MGHSPPFVARYGASVQDEESGNHPSTSGTAQRKHISQVLIIAGFFFFVLAVGLIVGDARLEGFLLHQQEDALVDNSQIIIDVVSPVTAFPTADQARQKVNPTDVEPASIKDHLNSTTANSSSTVTTNNNDRERHQLDQIKNVSSTVRNQLSNTTERVGSGIKNDNNVGENDKITNESLVVKNHLNISSGSFDGDARLRTAQSDFQNSLRKGHRTICTLMKDEVQFVDEWVTYHLRLGWNKIVIYDDGSTDGTAKSLSKFPNHLVEVRNVTWPKPTSSRYGFTTLQEKAFPDCFIRYWNVSSVLVNLDVDEFLYPEERFWQYDDPLWEGFLSSQFLQPNRTILVQYPLIDFGFGDHIDTPNGSVIEAYTQRMPIIEQETANYTGQHPQALLKTPTPGKVLYFPNGVTNVILPSVHYPVGGWKHHSPMQASTFRVNHYRFRSVSHLMAKFQKNKYGGSLTRLPKDHPTFQFYNWCFDDKIIRFSTTILPRLDLYNSSSSTSS